MRSHRNLRTALVKSVHFKTAVTQLSIYTLLTYICCSAWQAVLSRFFAAMVVQPMYNQVHLQDSLPKLDGQMVRCCTQTQDRQMPIQLWNCFLYMVARLLVPYLHSGSHAWRCNAGAVKSACRPKACKGDAIDGLHTQHPPQRVPSMHSRVSSLQSIPTG